MKHVLSLAFIFMCLTSIAQDKMMGDKDMMDFPEMSRAAGVSFQKFDGLNSRIANLPQYKELKNAAGVLQLGWFKEQHRVVTQLNLMAGSSMSGDRDKRSSTIRYLGAGADIGFDVIKSEKVALFPLVGLGYQIYQARFFRDNSGVDFNSVLQSPAVQSSIQAVDFKNGFFNYRAGIGFAVRSAAHSCSIGVQAIYTGSFSDHEWKSNQAQRLANAPSDGLSQIYAGLVFTCRPFFMMRHKNM